MVSKDAADAAAARSMKTISSLKDKIAALERELEEVRSLFS